MPTTTNFGWTTPADTDLVKDGAAAIRTLGNGVDTSFLDLKGGSTGQVLAKASNTDLDFSWVAQDDSNAIQNAIVDAKGDLISATAADTPARLAVGTNGQILSADSSEATGLKWIASPAGAALTCVKAQTSFSAVTSVTADTVFTSSYTNYRIILNYTTSTTNSILLRLRASGSSTASGYNTQFIEANNTSLSTARSAGTSFSLTEWTNGAFNSTAVLDLFNPQVATGTTLESHGTVSLGGYGVPFIKISYGNQDTSTQFDGVEFFVGSGTFTGSYTIYAFGKTL
jgi:hypothetical protein